MKLQTSQLRQFRAAAQGIKQNNLLPILSYLKFDNGTITKNSLDSFVQMKSDFKGVMLIDERSLYTFLDFTDADTIDVTAKGTSITITDGKTKKVLPTDDIKVFPATADPGSDIVELNIETLQAIKTALSFTNEDGANEFSKYVFIGNGLIGATNNFIAYTQPTIGLPEMVIGKDAAIIIAKYSSVTFSENDTYQFYEIGDFKYGFCKTETPMINLTPHSKLPNIDRIEANKYPIIKFCDMCVSDCPSRVVVAEFFGGAMQMNDAAYSISNTSPLDVMLEDFTFNPGLMSKLLKSVPGDNLQFVKSGAKYYITDGNFVALIMEIKP